MLPSPLTDIDTCVLFVDLQDGVVNIARTAEPQRLRECVTALATAAAICELPMFAAVVPTMSGTVAPLIPEIGARVPPIEPIVRTTADPLAGVELREALERAGRRTLIVAGVATEVAVQLGALSAARLGYSVIVAVDACGGLDQRSEDAAFRHLASAGITLSSVPAIVAALAGDFSTERGRAAMHALQPLFATHHVH